MTSSSSPNGWICAAECLPPAGTTFVMTSLRWKEWQYVVKKQWTAAENRNNAKALASLYWLALPKLPEPANEK